MHSRNPRKNVDTRKNVQVREGSLSKETGEPAPGDHSYTPIGKTAAVH